MDGAPGADAPIPLTGRDSDVVIDSLNAGKDEDEATEYMIDLHAMGYFNGGMAPFMYKVVSIIDSDTTTDLLQADGTFIADSPVVTGKIDEDSNELVLKLDPGHSWAAADWSTGFTVNLSAEDANKESATSSLIIMPNQAPQNATGVEDSANDGVITSDESEITIGTMEGDVDANGDTDGTPPREDGVVDCAMFNSCEMVLFQDQNDYTLSVVADPPGHLSWSDEGDGKLVLTGMMATASPVEVDVTATDSDGLTSTLRFNVVVDAAPTVSEDGQAVSKTIEIDMVGATREVFDTTAAAQNAFMDTQTPTISFESANESIVTVADTDGGLLTGAGRGTTTVTMRGTTGTQGTPHDDGLGQFAEIVFTVTVK